MLWVSPQCSAAFKNGTLKLTNMDSRWRARFKQEAMDWYDYTFTVGHTLLKALFQMLGVKKNKNGIVGLILRWHDAVEALSHRIKEEYKIKLATSSFT